MKTALQIILRHNSLYTWSRKDNGTACIIGFEIRYAGIPGEFVSDGVYRPRIIQIDENLLYKRFTNEVISKESSEARLAAMMAYVTKMKSIGDEDMAHAVGMAIEDGAYKRRYFTQIEAKLYGVDQFT